MRRTHRSPVNSPHKGQWREALIYSLICAWISNQLSKQWWGWWFETPWRSLWRHRNDFFVCFRMRRAAEAAAQPEPVDRSRPSDGFPGLLRQEKMIGGNVCEYTHVWEVRPTPNHATTPPGGGTRDDVNLDVIAGTLKSHPGDPIYEARAAIAPPNRDPRMVCHKSDAPMYFEFDPHGNPHVCAIWPDQRHSLPWMCRMTS